MKNLNQIIGILLLVFFSCSRDYPTGTSVQKTVPRIDEQVSSAKKVCPDVLYVFRTATAPVIDGKQDQAWEIAPNNKISNNFETYEQSPINGPKDLSAKFKAMWDESYLYLFVTVKDDELNTSSDPWLNDGIQLYFDGDNSKNTLSDCSGGWPGAYDSDDNQITAAFGQDVSTYPNWVDPSLFNFAYRQQLNGYTIEAALPFDALLFSAAEGHFFGFEIQVNDNDLGVRQNVLLWYADEGECIYLNPSLWGTAILIEKR